MTEQKSYICWMQTYLDLLCFILLCLQMLHFVCLQMDGLWQCLCWTNLLVLLFQQHLVTLCHCVTFWHQEYFNVFSLLLIYHGDLWLGDLWCNCCNCYRALGAAKPGHVLCISDSSTDQLFPALSPSVSFPYSLRHTKNIEIRIINKPTVASKCPRKSCTVTWKIKEK